MNTIQSILDRGFGMVPINDLMSINYCNGEMKLIFTPAPGFTEESVYYLLEGRTCGEILSEIWDLTVQYMVAYTATIQESIKLL